jgi:hypothetical protein
MELGCRISKLSGFLNIPTLEWDQCDIQHLGGSWRPNDLSGVGFSRQKVQQPIRLCGQSQTSFVSYIDVIRTHLDRSRERNLMRKGVGQKNVSEQTQAPGEHPLAVGARTSAEQRERPQKTLIKALGVWAGTAAAKM